MTDAFHPFPKIFALKNVANDLRHESKPATIHYGAKVKLHGTNAAVRVSMDGTVTPQKRNGDLLSGPDNAGFRAYVLSSVDAWRSAAGRSGETIVVFGEWAGLGVQKAIDAVAQLPSKFFFAFGVQIGAKYFCDPDVVKNFVPAIPQTRVIPWFVSPDDERLAVCFLCEESVEKFAEAVNNLVALVEKEDPLIAEWFDIHGPGEGVVLTAQTVSVHGETFGDGMDIEMSAEFQFKAKCERHIVQTSASGKPATTKVVAPTGVAEFVAEFVNEGRCRQGVSEGCDGVVARPRTKDFVLWMRKDVKDESAAELRAMGIEWKSAEKAVNQASSKWYIAKCNEA